MPEKIGKISKTSYFPTLVFQAYLDSAAQLNRELMGLINDERTRDSQGIKRSNVAALGGWHSHNLLQKSAGFEPFVRQVNEIAQHISTDLAYAKSYPLEVSSMWSIVNPPGSFNLAHIHPGCLWSGVYYVQAPRDSGSIQLVDPRTANIMMPVRYENPIQPPRECSTTASFKPRAGKLIIFPAWLYHSVAPNLVSMNEDEGDRVVIAFNLSQIRSNK